MPFVVFNTEFAIFILRTLLIKKLRINLSRLCWVIKLMQT